jgi:hypothetical protein
MGAWDAGSFQNDTALDWAGNLSEKGDVAAIRVALVRVLEERHSEPYLEVRVACEGLAAAEIIAFWLGHPDQHFPHCLREWADRHSDSLSPDLVALARQAVCTIKTNSELKDLWEEGNGIVAPKWYAAIADLERRLQSD